MSKVSADEWKAMAMKQCARCGGPVTARRAASFCSKSCAVRARGHAVRSHPNYVIWQAMKARCYYQGHSYFSHYGGRGITVCDRWRDDFHAFATDMGERPVGMTIDRIDNDRGYEPSNCRWATREQQTRNRSISRLDEESVTFIRMSMRIGARNIDLSRRFGVSASSIVAIRAGRSWKGVAQ